MGQLRPRRASLRSMSRSLDRSRNKVSLESFHVEQGPPVKAGGINRFQFALRGVNPYLWGGCRSPRIEWRTDEYSVGRFLRFLLHQVEVGENGRAVELRGNGYRRMAATPPKAFDSTSPSSLSADTNRTVALDSEALRNSCST